MPMVAMHNLGFKFILERFFIICGNAENIYIREGIIGKNYDIIFRYRIRMESGKA